MYTYNHIWVKEHVSLTMVTCMAFRSASLKTATERIPSLRADRNTRQAISPRLATRIFSMGRRRTGAEVLAAGKISRKSKHCQRWWRYFHASPNHSSPHFVTTELQRWRKLCLLPSKSVIWFYTAYIHDQRGVHNSSVFQTNADECGPFYRYHQLSQQSQRLCCAGCYCLLFNSRCWTSWSNSISEFCCTKMQQILLKLHINFSVLKSSIMNVFINSSVRIINNK